MLSAFIENLTKFVAPEFVLLLSYTNSIAPVKVTTFSQKAMVFMADAANGALYGITVFEFVLAPS